MKARRVVSACVLAAACAGLACSNNDTVVALNVNVGSGVGFVSKFHVTIMEDGQTPFDMDLTMLPTMTNQLTDDAGNDAGSVVVLMSGNLPPVRLTLPSSWTSETASLQLSVFDMSGAEITALRPAPVQVGIVQGGAVAAFVNVQFPPPDAGSDAADDGEAGAMDATTVDTGVDAEADAKTDAESDAPAGDTGTTDAGSDARADAGDAGGGG